MNKSQQWWDKVKQDQPKLLDWLKSQYHGEKTAAIRIRGEFSKFDLKQSQLALIEKIAKEEELHADWVGELLASRGLTPELLNKKERYWEKTMVNMDTLEDVAAIAHHAENMRLERIQVIVDDPETPEDIREVFAKILPMEVNHEKWFAALSNEEAILSHKGNHSEGRQVLGLVP
jgi:hypothetical protein